MWPELSEPVLRAITSLQTFELLAVVALTSTRFAIILTFMPIFAELHLPVSLRYAGALALSAPLLPTVDLTADSFGILPWDWFLLVLKEMCLGVILMVIVSLPFWVVDLAGDIIELQRGMGNEAVTDPNDLIQSQPTGRLFFLLFLLFVLTSGGLLIILDIIYQSFVVFPVMSTPDLRDLAGTLIDGRLFETIFEYGLLILLPALLLLMLTDIVIALMTRFAQQLNVLQLILVLKGLIVVLVLPFYGPGLLLVLDPLLEDIAARFQELVP